MGAIFAALMVMSSLQTLSIPSVSLTRALGQPTSITMDVLLPDGYESGERYPVVYWFEAFGDQFDASARRTWGDWVRACDAERTHVIVVTPDPMFEGVYTEFADSASLGPWGEAFTTEVAPYVDAHFHTSVRYLAGHSSGAWAALWLQTTYPALFAGAWAYSPDPVDFHDFTGPDLTAVPPGNFFHDAHGAFYTIVHEGNRDAATLQTFVSMDPIQFVSFDAVFSPADEVLHPRELFDRRTGAIDPAVAAYWEAHYDISARVAGSWASDAQQLRGKLHLIVGSADTFHLERPAHRFCDELDRLGARAECSFINGADHWTPLKEDDGYERHILREIVSSQAPASASARD